MRVIVFGAGAVGGAIGAKLFEQGNDVTLIARGANYSTLAKNGVRLETPSETLKIRVPVVESLSEASLDLVDFVILTVKSQDLTPVLHQITSLASPTAAIVCGQNGVENERVLLRHFQNVYGMCVMCPATHIEPGVVQVNSSPVLGALDVGIWPRGVDDRSAELASVLRTASFDSIARDDIARWKWAKLLLNLSNTVEAVCGLQTTNGMLAQRAVQEGIEVLKVADIAHVSLEDLRQRGSVLNLDRVSNIEQRGGSSWQSLVRGTGSIETDFLTGEVILQARLHRIAAPVNKLLQELANRLASEHRAPGCWSEAEVLSMLRAD